MSVHRRLSVATIALLALLAAGPLTPGAAGAAPPGPTDDATGFQLINLHSGRCLTVAPGDLAVQRQCREAAPLLWRLRLVTPTGLFEIRNVGSGRCLIIGSAGDRRAGQARCDGTASHRWRLLDGAGDSFLIHNAGSGRCLAIAGVTSDPAVVQHRCDGDRARRWTARLIGGNRP